jgi:hypothetical protein
VYEAPELAHDIIISGLCEYFIRHDFSIMGLTNSCVRGNNDALEYFICLDCDKQASNINYQHYINKIIEDAGSLEKFKKNEFINLN